MMRLILFLVALVLPACLVLSQIPATYEDNEIRTYIEKSVPYIGANVPIIDGVDGTGIRVAVIDTGVDFNHPDLFGWGEGGKVAGGYNFVHRGHPPIDTNGHGTQVAGIIAADGHVKGIAPKAEILAYKVSENGEKVSGSLITRAIDMAIKDEADIINISLGINVTSNEIERAVNRALQEGIVVVTAAGNDGSEPETIGSPGSNRGSITVGATYNNLTASLVATLNVQDKQYTAIPMRDSVNLMDPIIGKIVFGGHGKAEELKDIDVTDAIVLVKRGSDIQDEMLYFSIKEKNVADAGGGAMIVYNSEPGIFLGELVHEFVAPGYEPQIPVVSTSMQDGLEIREMIDGVDDDGSSNTAVLHLFYNPDFVAHFSSRGPVSPFYIKPEIMAPGAYINTTQNNAGYNFTSGTSYAAPHISGAAAVLLQKNPWLLNHEIKSLLLTTSKPVSDPYGNGFTIHDAGTGRVDLAMAYNAEMMIIPPNFVISVSPDNPEVTKHLKLKPINGALTNEISITFVGDEQIKFSHAHTNNTIQVTIGIDGDSYGEYEGRIMISDGVTEHTIPFLLHYTQGSIQTRLSNQDLIFDISHPDGWDFAKITVINSHNGETRTVTATPNRDASIKLYKNAQYWIDAKITTHNKDVGNISSAFDVINVDVFANNSNTLQQQHQQPYWQFLSQSEKLADIPARQIGIIAAAATLTGIIGLIFSRRTSLSSR